MGFYLSMVLLLGGIGLVMLIINWLNPPLKPPEDEWQKWKDL